MGKTGIDNTKNNLKTAKEKGGSRSKDKNIDFYRFALQHIDDFVSFVDKDYCYRAVSRGYLNFFRLSEHQVIGQFVWELHGNERFNLVLKPNLDRALIHGETFSFNAEIQSSNGETCHIESRHTPYRDANQEITGVIVIARDMNRVWEAEQRLHKEVELCQLVIDSTPDFVFFKDVEGSYQRCNQAFRDFLGLPDSEIIGRTDQQLMSSESAQYIRERDQLVFSRQLPSHNEEWVTYNNSRRRLLDMSKVPVFDDDHRLVGLLGVGRDITREREAERRSKQASLLFEVTSDPCLIIEADGIISAANPACHKVFGYQGNQLPGIPVGDLLFPPPDEMSLTTLLNRKSWKGQLMGVHLNGQANPFLVNISSVLGDGEEIVSQVITMLDMGEVAGLTQDLSHKAYHDPLTGLPNRHLMLSRLQHAVAQAQRNDDFIAVLFIDLDGFKGVNDRYGHSFGDLLLKEVGERLKTPLRNSDTLVRLGGDEFVIILERLLHVSGINPVLDKLLKSVAESPVEFDNISVNISISIGVSVFPNHASHAELLVKYADRAMYVAKANGRNQACFFHSSLSIPNHCNDQS
ncbi:MAG: diguanylate cyclase [Motiliproteus sp.]|nr:diguanylate cyclase [Motiliproteus sp.]MCW9051164.1 diguanylate cyclase [Motiliproteus sp.]